MSSMNKYSFIFSFPIYTLFISFSRFIAIARTSRLRVKRTEERSHCLVLYLSRINVHVTNIEEISENC